VYFEFSVIGTSSIKLELYNRARTNATNSNDDAIPVSLLVLVGDEEYSIFPNASRFVDIRQNKLEINLIHMIRVVAPLLETVDPTTIQLKGIWLDKGGTLVQHSEKMKKTLEVITDLMHPTTQSLGGVNSWSYLLGEMFDADHLRIGMHGMCLIAECIGGNGFPASIGDVFFRSGPPGTTHFRETWQFRHPPNIMVNIITKFMENQQEVMLKM
jgi:hypothetical protein